MNAFSKIDMAEVTRLTRAGKLGEALALLQGRAAPARSEPKGAARTRLIPRPPRESEPKRSAPSDETASFPDPAPAMRAFRARPPKPRAFPGSGLRRGRSSLPIAEGARFEERVFANSAGRRSYKVYVPSGYAGQRLPVVVMLHGCTQDPDDFAAGTRMNDVAEERMFLVAYPHQPSSANVKNCWNWFNADEQRRGGGEPSLLAGVASQVVEEFSADPTRVYVAGLSAGGAAAAILAKAYPDVFAAAGVHSGLACGAARDMPSAFAAMSGNARPSPKGAGAVAPTIVFHGDADRIVHVVNADQVAAQARPAGGLTEVVTERATPDGMRYTRTVERDAEGRAVIEQWVLHGAGHAWSGGSLEGSYADPRGPDASREMARFFLQHSLVG